MALKILNMAFVDSSKISDQAILQELGERFRALRLRRNLTQQQLADRTLLSLNTIKALEAGRAKLSTLVAVLRELGALDQLAALAAGPEVSPMQLAKLKGKPRQRASGSRGKLVDDQGEVEW